MLSSSPGARRRSVFRLPDFLCSALAHGRVLVLLLSYRFHAHIPRGPARHEKSDGHEKFKKQYGDATFTSIRLETELKRLVIRIEL